MHDQKPLQKRKLTWTLLFIGFCCVFGWMGTNVILLTYFTGSRSFENISTVAIVLLRGLAFTSFYVILGIAAFAWGVNRFKRTEQKKGLLAISLVPAALLTPVTAIGGIAVILVAPLVYAHARVLVVGPNVVQSAASPDGRYEAFVIDKPSIDGPNHHLYVKNTQNGKETFVANLPEDVDSNQQIIWSPYGDIVVFRTHFKLIAYSLAKNQKQEVKLGGDYHWRSNGTFWVDYEDVLDTTDLQFPSTGVLSFRLQGVETPQTITF